MLATQPICEAGRSRGKSRLKMDDESGGHVGHVTIELFRSSRIEIEIETAEGGAKGGDGQTKNLEKNEAKVHDCALLEEKTSKLQWANLKEFADAHPRASFFLQVVFILVAVKFTCQLFMVLTGYEASIVVVLSSSMRPTMDRGDVLFLNLWVKEFDIGDIVVFTVEGKDIPIVHRITEKQLDELGEPIFLTKGDNNAVNDRIGAIYAPGQEWIQTEDIKGSLFGFIPKVGYFAIWMNENPVIRVGILLFTLAGLSLGAETHTAALKKRDQQEGMDEVTQ